MFVRFSYFTLSREVITAFISGIVIALEIAFEILFVLQYWKHQDCTYNFISRDIHGPIWYKSFVFKNSENGLEGVDLFSMFVWLSKGVPTIWSLFVRLFNRAMEKSYNQRSKQWNISCMDVCLPSMARSRIPTHRLPSIPTNVGIGR